MPMVSLKLMGGVRVLVCAHVCPVCVPWCLFTGHIYKVEILGTLSAVRFIIKRQPFLVQNLP